MTWDQRIGRVRAKGHRWGEAAGLLYCLKLGMANLRFGGGTRDFLYILRHCTIIYALCYYRFSSTFLFHALLGKPLGFAQMIKGASKSDRVEFKFCSHFEGIWFPMRNFNSLNCNIPISSGIHHIYLIV